MHEDAAEGNADQCKACHGDDYHGSVLSKTWIIESFWWKISKKVSLKVTM